MSQHGTQQRSISATKSVTFTTWLVSTGTDGGSLITVNGIDQVQEFLGSMVELAKSLPHQVRDASVTAGSNTVKAKLVIGATGAKLQVDAFRPERGKDLSENVG